MNSKNKEKFQNGSSDRRSEIFKYKNFCNKSVPTIFHFSPKKVEDRRNGSYFFLLFVPWIFPLWGVLKESQGGEDGSAISVSSDSEEEEGKGKGNGKGKPTTEHRKRKRRSSASMGEGMGNIVKWRPCLLPRSDLSLCEIFSWTEISDRRSGSTIRSSCFFRLKVHGLGLNGTSTVHSYVLT